MDYLGIMNDLIQMSEKAGRLADTLWLINPDFNKRLNIFYRECFEFYKDIEDILHDNQ